MYTRIWPWGIAVGVLLGPTRGIAQQTSTAQSDSQTMAALAACAQAQRQIAGLVEAAGQRVEMARQTNHLSVLRAAVDDLQITLARVKTELAPCAALQSMAPADPHGRHVMPSTASPPAAAPGRPVMNPGSTAPAPAAVAPAAPVSGATAPHAGHVMPAAPRAPAAAPRATPQRPASAPAGGTAAPRAAETPSLAVDQVCGVKVDPSTAPRASYQGQTYYFCSEQHRQLFLKDSAKYAQKERR